jgi:Bacterial transglutaminase-like cysteine proteinase BTLCP
MPHVPCSISNVAARRPARLSPVLTVKTDRGEFILDNQEPQVLPWTQTGYRFVTAVADQPEFVGLAWRTTRSTGHGFSALTEKEFAFPVTSPPPPRPQTWFASGRPPPRPAAPFDFVRLSLLIHGRLRTE